MLQLDDEFSFHRPAQQAALDEELSQLPTWLRRADSFGSAASSPRSQRSGRGEGLFDSYDDDDSERSRGDATPARPPAAPPLGQMWGSLMNVITPRGSAQASQSSAPADGRTSDAALERAAELVQRFARGKLARLKITEINRRFKLLELYVRRTPPLLPYARTEHNRD